MWGVCHLTLSEAKGKDRCGWVARNSSMAPPTHTGPSLSLGMTAAGITTCLKAAAPHHPARGGRLGGCCCPLDGGGVGGPPCP
jgi:hypothetical protein